ncbi:MAG: fumarylacetoacetate hydrolase family protein [Candidatus Hodarchaeales archaeon]
MRLATIKRDQTEKLVLVTNKGVIPVERINDEMDKNWSTNMLRIIESGQLEEMNDWYRSTGKNELADLEENVILFENVDYAPLYRHPKKIWGIGLNYVEHARDLSVKSPTTEPVSFMKPDTTIIGQGDTIKIPVQSEKTTGEAELGVIIGKRCKDVERKEWLNAIAGFTPIIDITAEDILRRNTRYLTLSKSFDTFFSFGPHFVTPDEIENVTDIRVATVINGNVHAQNTISNMNFPLDYLLSFHSKVMTLLPGDIISTGTPRAVHINDGDVIECRIDGFEPLINPVIDLKNKIILPS